MELIGKKVATKLDDGTKITIELNVEIPETTAEAKGIIGDEGKNSVSDLVRQMWSTRFVNTARQIMSSSIEDRKISSVEDIEDLDEFVTSLQTKVQEDLGLNWTPQTPRSGGDPADALYEQSKDKTADEQEEIIRQLRAKWSQ